jgi:Uncharacterised protein family (UPF0158)
MAKKLPIDFADLRIALEDHGYESSWVLDTATGEVILLSDSVDEEDLPAPLEEIENSKRFLPIEPRDSHESWLDMEDFIATVADAHLRELLEVAVAGKGAFRRFKDVLGRAPEERERWFRFQAERLDRVLREWLAENGIEPVAKSFESTLKGS